MKDIIILNGPPGSGKDAISRRMVEILGDKTAVHMEVKARLFELALSISGMDEATWWSLYNNRVLKETPDIRLANKSPRQFMIHVSEKIIKPLYGTYYFGCYAAQRVRKAEQSIVVFSDGGFKDEVIALSQVGNIHLVHLHRAGCSFSGDSRNYIDPNLGCLSSVLAVEQIEGNINAAVAEIYDHILDWRLK